MALGVGVVMAVYLALNAIFRACGAGGGVGWEVGYRRVAARALGGDTLQNMGAGLIALALATSIFVDDHGGARIYARMAR